MTSSTIFWRRTDAEGLERLALASSSSGIEAVSTVLCIDEGGFRLDHHWVLDPDWRTQALTIERTDDEGRKGRRLERHGEGWLIDGERRPEFDGALEPDLSVTPFCNSLPIRRLRQAGLRELVLDTVFVDGPALDVVRSRQHYRQTGPLNFRYVDLGAAQGFEADLLVDEDGLIVRYEHLFERAEIRRG